MLVQEAWHPIDPSFSSNCLKLVDGCRRHDDAVDSLDQEILRKSIFPTSCLIFDMEFDLVLSAVTEHLKVSQYLRSVSLECLLRIELLVIADICACRERCLIDNDADIDYAFHGDLPIEL